MCCERSRRALARRHPDFTNVIREVQRAGLQPGPSVLGKPRTTPRRRGRLAAFGVGRVLTSTGCVVLQGGCRRAVNQKV